MEELKYKDVIEKIIGCAFKKVPVKVNVKPYGDKLSGSRILRIFGLHRFYGELK